jgi:hypothetical protein
MTWEDEATLYVTYQVFNTIWPQLRFKPYDILLDNQADVSVIRPDLLRDILLADVPITVSAIGGKQLTVHKMGYLQDFFRVYASINAEPNVLCLLDVEDMYKVTCIPGQAFVVHLPS